MVRLSQSINFSSLMIYFVHKQDQSVKNFKKKVIFKKDKIYIKRV